MTSTNKLDIYGDKFEKLFNRTELLGDASEQILNQVDKRHSFTLLSHLYQYS